MLLHLIKVITAYRPNKFSKQIKLKTKKLHDEIEAHPFFRSMLDGTLSDDHYYVYLYNLLPIYKSVEYYVLDNLLTEDIKRSDKVLKDILNYNKTCNHIKLDASTFYCNEWLDYFYKKDAFFKKTELYIRWLADLYGGQILKKKVEFGEKYEFKNVRKAIKTVRKLIEKGLNESNVDRFIEEVNKSYAFHKHLADKILLLKID
jgi:heme oxygenase